MAMNGRSIVSFIFSLIVVGILVGIGVGIYQAGVAQGVIDAGRFPAGAAVPVAGYGYGDHGFGFLGLLFPILFLFLIFGVLRAVFSRGRGWGHGYGRGYGWGPGWDRTEGEGPTSGGPAAWRDERDRRISEMHRRLHETEGDPGSTTGGSGSSGGPASR
jgi:hypothetical protein